MNEPGPSPADGHLPESGRGVYGISVAAELAGVTVQTLRLYEQHGLLTPSRSPGGTRRYSGDDLARIRRITQLAGQGINLAAIARIIDLEDANADLHARNRHLKNDNERLRHES